MRHPRRIALAALAALVALVALSAACAPVGTRELHEVVLAGSDGATKLRYVYGSADTMVLNARERRIGGIVRDAADDVPYAVPAARSVDGAPYLRTRIDRGLAAPIRVARIPLSSDLRVRTEAPVRRAFYFDGSTWLSLGRDLEANRTRTVSPSLTSGRLRGAGSLTPAEADAVADAIAAEGRPALVAVLPSDAYRNDPEAGALHPRAEDGLDEYRHTLLWIQREVEVDPSAYTPPAQERIFDVVARGDQGEDPGSDRFALLPDRDALRRFWNEVHAETSAPPPLPDARFGRETLLGVRLSARPSGGYGIEVAGVERDGRELFVDLRLTEPPAGAPTTQAITTPWALVRVLGLDASVAWFRDADSGELIAVAREGGSESF